MQQGSLERSVGLGGAVWLGLGSILGTGVYVSLGLGAGPAGDALLLALVAGAVLAAANGLSSARLAAAFPVSGGTYEYGTRVLHPWAGFTAGWFFLGAKSASAATAALGVAGYVLQPLGAEAETARTALAVAAVALLTALAAGGLSRSNRANAITVTITLVGLFGLVVVGLAALGSGSVRAPEIGAPPTWSGFLHATALLFVAYTGYGRVATLGEEIHDPARSIPRAVILTVLASLVVYGSVAWVALAALGPERLGALTGETAAPLESVALALDAGWMRPVLAVSAVTAMVGVLLNLLLGLSRVVLAMARRGDLPTGFGAIDGRSNSPRRAVVGVGVFVASLAALGDVRLTWTLSAFTVLVYYALTNLSALRLPAGALARAVQVLAALGCAGLAFAVPATAWLVGGIFLVGGFLLRAGIRRSHKP